SLSCQATVIMVSNEVGLGIVPANVSGRFFRDLLGEANQMVASSSNQVYLMVAGIPLLIKGNNNG
ncbi:MAG: bifunctional adenosylcobinamide kinase/adenosylcobinamide-phosphate guanylyltransferase, partial [Candidatus Caldatribacteriota bacterium]